MKRWLSVLKEEYIRGIPAGEGCLLAKKSIQRFIKKEKRASAIIKEDAISEPTQKTKKHI